MPDSNPELQAVTVLGMVPGDQLGIVLPHEHVTIDNGFNVQPRQGVDSTLPVRTHDIGATRVWPRSKRDNLVLDRDELVVDELRWFRELGGSTIVEMTTSGNGRDLPRLIAVSEASGVGIVATAGCYVAATHPKEARESSIDALADRFIRDLLEGPIRCGALGEIGLGRQPDAQEWKALESALIASQTTGAPVWIHITTLEPLEVLLAWLRTHRHPAERVVVCHMDHELRDLRLHREALELGLTIEFDLFGMPAWTGGPFLHAPTDTARLETLIQLALDGWADQLLISQDVCQKIQLRAFGGFGYGHILENVRPLFNVLNAPDGLFEKVAIETPRRLLTWAKP